MSDDPVRIGALLAGLDPAARDALEAASHPLPLRKGQIVFRTGEAPDAIYSVVTGKVKLTRRPVGDDDVRGRETLLGIVGPGQMFGELSVFDPGPRNSTAIALSPATVRRISAADVEYLVTAYPSIARALLRQLARRLRLSNENTTDIVLHDVSGRVANVVLMLSTRFGERKADGIHVDHDLTQAEIATMVGASRETVNKVLTDFAARDWVRLSSRALVVLDERKLRARAHNLG